MVMDFIRVRNNISFRQLIVIGTLVLVSFCYCRGAEKVAHFYFNTEAGLKAMGITSPKDGFVLTNVTCTAEDISLRFTKGDLDPSIIKSSDYFLRLVKNCTMTVSAGEGMKITSIKIDGTRLENLVVDGSFSQGTWTGSAGSVLFTVSTGSVQINSMDIYYDDGAGEEVVRGVFSLVTSDDQLKIGNRYIIVNADKTHLAGTFANNKLAGVTTGFTMDNTNDQITVTGNDIEIITFEKSTTNGFFLLRNSRGSYYNVDSPDNDSKLTEVTDGSRVSVKLKNGLVHMAFQPGASRSLRFVSDNNAYFEVTYDSGSGTTGVYLYYCEGGESGEVEAISIADLGQREISDQVYQIDETLIGVEAVGDLLFARSEAGEMIESGDFLLEEALSAEARSELAQKGIGVPEHITRNDWIVLKLPEKGDATDLVGKELTRGSVIGVIADEGETLSLTQMPVEGEEASTALNIYSPANFNDAYWSETSTYHFTKPADNEVVQIVWAIWDGEKFEMPKGCPAGEIRITDWSLNTNERQPTLTVGYAYAFKALVSAEEEASQSSKRLKATPGAATSFNIKPLNLTASSPVTAITTVWHDGCQHENGDCNRLRIYDISGNQLCRLEPGINIVVDESGPHKVIIR